LINEVLLKTALSISIKAQKPFSLISGPLFSQQNEPNEITR
jgi:hypothetical protein